MAVRGIAEHGLPILPSGLLYDRGILYSYASWIAHAISGSELPAYRALSVVCAILALWLVFKLVGRVRNQVSGMLAAALVATSVPFWATATSARFYAPFLALYLATLISMTGVRDPALAGLLLAFLARLTHELAFTLAVIPLVCLALRPGQWQRWTRVFVAIVAGLVFGQALLLVLHWMSPTSGDTMVKRFFLWQVLNLFERPGDRQFAIPLVVMVLAWLVAPRKARPASVIATGVAVAIFTFSVARASNVQPVTLELIKTIAVEGSRYPLDMFWHIARATPLTLLCAMLGFALRAGGAGGEWLRRERAFHALWIGWVLWFGVIESGITTNYLLLPTTFMLMAIAADLAAILVAGDIPARRYFGNPSRAAWASLLLLSALIAGDQWRRTSLDMARPTIVGEGIAEIKSTLQPKDRVVCTDELGCVMLVGRVDRWLALDDYVRERFLVRRGDGPVTGVYTGVPAVMRPAEALAPNPDGTLPDRVIIVDIFKEYPIGNSRTWLPRAIEEDGVRVVPLLETPQLRVIEISAPEAIARLQPLP